MKRFVTSILIILLLFLIPTTTLEASFRLTYDTRTTTYYDGVRQTKYVGTINYNDTESIQIINYMGANPTTASDLNIVTGDNYLDYEWGKGTLNQIITNVNNRYDNYHVIGGVNGDFYGANGIPIEAYIRNFEVLSAGLGNQRTVIGFKDDGSVIFGRPCFDGYEAIVSNKEGQIKHRFPIERINQYPLVPGGVSAFFDTYTSSITGDYNKIIFDSINTKHDDYGHTFFGKGLFQEETMSDTEVNGYHFVLVGDTLNSDGLFGEDDQVVVQQKLSCGWEDVRFALGGWERLVHNGVATEVYTEGAGPTYRHPRTAIGVKADGTVFFVTVDGRDYENGYLGVTAYELAEIMLYFDAVHAYNLDGGGSTTMVVENEDAEYIYLNNPSDGQPRSVSNGVFFVRGEHQELPPTLPYPDNRVMLDSPVMAQFDPNQLLTFGAVEHASSYDILIDQETVYTTIDPLLQLDLAPGLHFIQIKANGDYTDFKDSEYSPVIVYFIYDDETNKIIQLLKQLAQR
jgi:hypothetical protein